MNNEQRVFNKLKQVITNYSSGVEKMIFFKYSPAEIGWWLDIIGDKGVYKVLFVVDHLPKSEFHVDRFAKFFILWSDSESILLEIASCVKHISLSIIQAIHIETAIIPLVKAILSRKCDTLVLRKNWILVWPIISLAQTEELVTFNIFTVFISVSKF